MSAMFRSLSVRNYRLWFIGALVSNIGSWMQATTQNWVVLTDLTDNDAVAVGTTMALQFGPQLLLVPITGLIADRFDRRKIIMVTQSLLLLLGLGLGLLLILGHAELWHLYLFALALGLVNAVDGPARQTFVSDLVDEHNMSNAVALNAASFNAARMIGPAVSGLLIVLIGAGWVFVLNAVTFVAMIIALVNIRTSELRPRPRATRSKGQLAEGFRYVRGRPDLLVVFAVVFLIGAFGMNFPIFASTMAVEFGRGAGEYGLLSSILAIGSLTGALLAARRERARLRVVILASAGFGLAAITSSLMPTFWTFGVSLILIGFATVTMLTTANGYVQTTTEPAVRGRVMALYMAILMGGTPIGAPIVGAVANAFGPRWALIVGGVAGLVAAVIAFTWLVIAKDLRVRRSRDARLGVAVEYTGKQRARPTSVVPEDFSEQVALTSPITIPLPGTNTRHNVGSKRTPTGSIPKQHRARR
ncbi:MFS transporter [Labedella populi]|uniref:MFS transporter n=1 Tax=Labedella populi TaxID=2498850 RepID=A0A444QEV6_9MICO|nr:MFS transporter [Labedella populi]RWZ68054.1 MFS transporter [Labedella populi]